MAKLNYDKAYKELQSILGKIQSDDVSIEKLSEYVKKAKELSDFCKIRLREIEKDLENINED